MSGNGKAAMEALAALSNQLCGANPDLPQVLVRWWPERLPSASCAMGESGALIRVNLGMLTHLRLLIHLLCSCLGSITGDEARWGEDRLTVDQARGEYLAMIDEFVGGEPVPLYKTVLVHWGKRERFRRVATLAGLAYVIAHELGHADLLQAASATPGPFEVSAAEPEMISHEAETSADKAAFRLLRALAPLDQDEDLAFAYAAGAASALAIQACLFWFKASHSDETLAWTHPVPDLRLGMACLALGDPEEADRLASPTPRGASSSTTNKRQARIAALKLWLDTVTGVSLFREAALARDLRGRGLSPAQLMTLYVAYGIPVPDKGVSHVEERQAGEARSL
ncbi:hypothetical protein OHD62_18310 [Mesorhizobium sp. YC-39]|uniref:hypothetical protein n=1 Tax=unclassified Mesorhizobium TaxID=325217 RepID=UPI0021E7AAF8|nr:MULTISPECIES: hypothetical protein [unclassified Mesorhizobium]MCV3209798.1 hypothetical protein [Mesorhizobium sp. YC-2]MCV3230328.1 hypothetical protein [Mesorhizobium sp. YC-39]